MRNRFWETPRWSPEERQGMAALAGRTGLPDPVVRVLWNRGIRTPEALEDLLRAGKRAGDPWALPDMEAAVRALRTAIARRARIRVYGDYDADGITALALLVRALEAAGARVDWRVPNRFDEGYGLQTEAVEAAVREGVDLLVTVDCGTSSLEAAERARRAGLDLIITDHHALGPELPPARAVVNPERGGRPDPLSGAGVALWLARALLGESGVPETCWGLAAVGTVADVVPLTGDNRTVVLRGLGVLRRGLVPGVEALLVREGRVADDLDEEGLAFLIGPRLNAAGRMGAAEPAVQLLLAASRGEAEPLARVLADLNRSRQAVEREVLAAAWLALPRDGRGRLPDFVVVHGPGWHEGVIGIVAGRLREALARPVAVVSEGDGTGPAKGSARGVPGLDLVAHLARYRDLFLGLGGHRGAAGFSLDPVRVPELAERLGQSLDPVLRRRQFEGVAVDAVLPAAAVDPEVTRWLGRLAPFGHGFEPPRFVLAGEVEAARTLGRDGRHLRFRWRPHGMPGVAFGAGGVLGNGESGPALAGPGTVRVRRWRGREQAEWQAVELPCAAPQAAFGPRLRLGPAPEPLSGRVIRVVDSDRRVRQRARELGAEPYHWGRPRGELRVAEVWAQADRVRCLVVSQWRPWPRHLEGWADAVVWEVLPRSRRALAESAAWLNPGGQIWYDPGDEERQRERLLRKADRLVPARERLGRLWRAWEAGRSPLLPGRAVLEELELRPGEVEPGRRRPLTDSALFRLARAEWAEVRADQRLGVQAWAAGEDAPAAGGPAPGGGGQDEPVGDGSRIGF
ncbi:MAG: single-stranded-DNA-specific exonuclease RecJ [Firmicutes bacterium]|nr:single-stranded-DNA-specific exonuclease RecJ [Bacillota bacterium]